MVYTLKYNGSLLQSGDFKIQGNFLLHKMYFIVEKGI